MNSTTSFFNYCKQHQSYNPYCGRFGYAEVIEVACLCLFTIVGTFGNLLVICSIIYAKKVFKHGNTFFVNLAFADLIVSGFFLPTVIANVIKTDNALPTAVCDFAGFLVTVTCSCSICSLAFIAFNRYWSVAHSQSYPKVFDMKYSLIMVAFTWLWSILITSPTLFGWSKLMYDYKMEACSWDDEKTIAYNVFLMACAIFFPVVVIIFCYINLFKSVRSFRVKSNRQVNSSVESLSQNQQQRRQKKEIALLKTLAVTVVAFLICWMPYAIVVVFFSHSVPPHVKKVASRFGLCNSGVNFIIYGVLNPVFRRGYKNFIKNSLCSC